MRSARVVVLMSSYNGERYIRNQIDSICNQQGDFVLDIIVRDDGSSDDTINILEEYANQGKVRWYTGQNLKPARSFIDLILNVCGYDYYAFSDQDDFWYQDKIQCAIDWIKGAKKPAIYFSNAEIADEKLNSLNKVLYKKQPNTDFYTISCSAHVIGCTMVFNEELARIIREKERPTILTMHDTFMTKVCTAVNGDVYFDGKAHIKYRQHGNNVVGFDYRIHAKVKKRFDAIFHKADVSIADVAEEIIRIYGDLIPDKNIKWLQGIVCYKNSLFSRLLLAVSTKTRYYSKNIAVTNRLSILLGNL